MHKLFAALYSLVRRLLSDDRPFARDYNLMRRRFGRNWLGEMDRILLEDDCITTAEGLLLEHGIDDDALVHKLGNAVARVIWRTRFFGYSPPRTARQHARACRQARLLTLRARQRDMMA